MGEVTNLDLMTVLLDIKKDLGDTGARITSTTELLAQHIADDKALLNGVRTDITTIQMQGAKQRGFLAALTSVGSVLGAGVGYLVERAMFSHHS